MNLTVMVWAMVGEMFWIINTAGKVATHFNLFRFAPKSILASCIDC